MLSFNRSIILMLALTILAGCVTTGKVKPVVEKKSLSMAEGSSVTQLEDGRKGFMIAEVPQMDETSRNDFLRAVEMLNSQDNEQAVALLAQIIEQSPGVTAPYINIAIAYGRMGKWDQAEEHLKTALELVPDHPVACNEYGLLYRNNGKFTEAREIYEKAINRFPDYYPIHRNLGILCDLYLNDLECALAHYEVYSQAMPEDEQVKIWIADLKNRIGSK